MINTKASNWVDRGEPPEPTLTRVLASYLELEPSENAARLQEYAGAVRGMAEADATEVNIAGYLRSLESMHLSAEHPARQRRGAAIALWLVLLCESAGPSSWGTTLKEVWTSPFRSSFTRVFLVELGHRRCGELQLA